MVHPFARSAAATNLHHRRDRFQVAQNRTVARAFSAMCRATTPLRSARSDPATATVMVMAIARSAVMPVAAIKVRKATALRSLDRAVDRTSIHHNSTHSWAVSRTAIHRRTAAIREIKRDSRPRAIRIASRRVVAHRVTAGVLTRLAARAVTTSRTF